MEFHPPRMPNVPEDKFELFQGVVTSTYRFHDKMLGRLVELAGPEAAVMLLSDHGFHSGRDRPQGTAELTPETPLQWHRHHGIFCLAGPGIRHDELVFGAGLLDITPTILALFGLPAAKDMPGRVLEEAFETPPAKERIPTWEESPGESGVAAASDGPEDAWDSAAALQQLAELGYIDAPTGDQKQQLAFAKDHQDFNLARLFMSRDRPADAIPLLERLAGDRPRSLTFRVYKALAYLRARRFADCRAMLESLPNKEEGDSKDRPVLNLMMGTLCMAEGNVSESLKHLLAAGKTQKPSAYLRTRIGLAYLRLRRWDDAEQSYRAALELDPTIPAAHSGLAAALGKQDRHKESAEAALDAVGLRYDLPSAHFHLGAALTRMGNIDRAIQAFETCLQFAPRAAIAHEWLAEIHKKATLDPERWEHHRQRAREIVAERRAAAQPPAEDGGSDAGHD